MRDCHIIINKESVEERANELYHEACWLEYAKGLKGDWDQMQAARKEFDETPNTIRSKQAKAVLAAIVEAINGYSD